MYHIREDKVVDILKRIKWYDLSDGVMDNMWATFKDELMPLLQELFSDDLETEEEGNWISIDDDFGSYLQCSECGYENHYYARFNYCPNCGEKMETYRR